MAISDAAKYLFLGRLNHCPLEIALGGIKQPILYGSSHSSQYPCHHETRWQEAAGGADAIAIGVCAIVATAVAAILAP
jgi:hypothetical protein